MNLRGCVLLAIIGTLASTTARADVIDEAESACRSAKEGDACDADGMKGTCKASSCSRRDYSDGPPGNVVSQACLRCIPGAPEEKAETKPDPAKPDPVKPDPAKPAESKGSSCTVGDTTRSFGMMFVGMLALGWLVRTRRPRA